MKRKFLVPLVLLQKLVIIFETMLTLNYSLVHTYLLYAISLWGSTYPTHLTKLKRLHNKALRIISKTPIKTRITPKYINLK